MSEGSHRSWHSFFQTITASWTHTQTFLLFFQNGDLLIYDPKLQRRTQIYFSVVFWLSLIRTREVFFNDKRAKNLNARMNAWVLKKNKKTKNHEQTFSPKILWKNSLSKKFVDLFSVSKMISGANFLFWNMFRELVQPTKNKLRFFCEPILKLKEVKKFLLF